MNLKNEYVYPYTPVLIDLQFWQQIRIVPFLEIRIALNFSNLIHILKTIFYFEMSGLNIW